MLLIVARKSSLLFVVACCCCFNLLLTRTRVALYVYYCASVYRIAARRIINAEYKYRTMVKGIFIALAINSMMPHTPPCPNGGGETDSIMSQTSFFVYSIFPIFIKGHFHSIKGHAQALYYLCLLNKNIF